MANWSMKFWGVLCIYLTLTNTGVGGAQECGTNPMKQIIVVAKRTGRPLYHVLTLLREIDSPAFNVLESKFKLYAACVGLVDTGYFKKRSSGTSHLEENKQDVNKSKGPAYLDMIKQDNVKRKVPAYLWNKMYPSRSRMAKDIANEPETGFENNNRLKSLELTESILDPFTLKNEDNSYEDQQNWMFHPNLVNLYSPTAVEMNKPGTGLQERDFLPQEKTGVLSQRPNFQNAEKYSSHSLIFKQLADELLSTTNGLTKSLRGLSEGRYRTKNSKTQGTTTDSKLVQRYIIKK